jgi:Peptidyl-tRNA hydrolase PTH2
MVLVTRRGAIATIERGGELAGAAAVACVGADADDPFLAAWRPRPGKVMLRARGGQWDEVLREPHVLAGDPQGASVIALPPRPRELRPAVLQRMQAMSSVLEPAPAHRRADDDRVALTYLLNPRATMSSGKTLAQIAHAAVLAAEELPGWAEAGAAARVLAPDGAAFDAARRRADLVAEVEDAGLTEVPPGTITVVALAPG